MYVDLPSLWVLAESCNFFFWQSNSKPFKNGRTSPNSLWFYSISFSLIMLVDPARCSQLRCKHWCTYPLLFFCQWEKKLTGSPVFFFAVGIRVQNPGSKRRYHRYLFFLEVAGGTNPDLQTFLSDFDSNKWKLFLGGNHSYSNLTFNFLKIKLPRQN